MTTEADTMSDEQLAASVRSGVKGVDPFIRELGRRGYNVFVEVSGKVLSCRTLSGVQTTVVEPKFEFRITREVSI